MIQSRSQLISVHVLGLLMVFGVKAFGQTSQELTCKAQAKEVALQTYQGCVTEARKGQMDTLRKEYSAKLSELKEHYNKELKKAAGKEAAKDTNEESNSSEEGNIQLKPTKKAAKTSMNMKMEKSTKGLARMLPKKQSKTVAALPVNTVSEDVKVVPAEETTSIETAASQMDTENGQGAE